MQLTTKQTLAAGFGVILLLIFLWSPILVLYFICTAIPLVFILAILYYAYKGFTNR